MNVICICLSLGNLFCHELARVTSLQVYFPHSALLLWCKTRSKNLVWPVSAACSVGVAGHVLGRNSIERLTCLVESAVGSLGDNVPSLSPSDPLAHMPPQGLAAVALALKRVKKLDPPLAPLTGPGSWLLSSTVQSSCSWELLILFSITTCTHRQP